MSPTQWHRRFHSTTRGRVLGLLRRRNLTVEELATALSMTDNGVRAHLASLERDGLVRQGGTRRGVGKPAYLYELTPDAERLFPKAHGVVLRSLLEALGGRLPPAELEALMLEVGRELAGKWRLEGADLEGRLREAIGVMGELGGVAELQKLEAGNRGGGDRADGDDQGDGETSYVIQSYSCPLATAATGHPEVCRLMEAFVEELVDAPVRECCDRGARPACRFEVKAGGEPSA
jgi:predicted ArsR family transcriptional regulator